MVEVTPPFAVAEALGIDVLDWTPVTAGWGGTELWRLRTAGGELLLRLFPTDEPGIAVHERAAHDFARAQCVPAPAVHAAGRFGGRVALLTDWVARPTLTEWLLRDPALAGPGGESTGRLLARLHAADPTPVAAGLRPDGWLAWAGWSDPERGTPPDDRMSVLHLDLHPGNLLAGPSGEVVALIDWANARVGPPAAELARTRTILDLAAGLPDYAGIRAGLEAFWAGLVSGYGGLPVDDRSWAWYLSWAAAVQTVDLGGRRPGDPGRPS